jgi:putative endonuclease
MARTFYVYLLASQRNGTLYVGVTSSLRGRMVEHKRGLKKGFTQEYGVKILVWYEEHPTALSATQREKNIKHWPRKWKLNLIEASNPDWNDLAPEGDSL